MGLFDFFKKKTVSDNAVEIPKQGKPIDKNLYFLEAFENKLIGLGYEIERDPEYLAFVVNSELEIQTLIINNPNHHPSIMEVMVLAIHSKYFPNGIKEFFVGTGATIEDQVNSALVNYIGSIFLTLIDGFSDTHNPNIDFVVNNNGKNILWHPKLGQLNSQGKWRDYPPEEHFFELLKELIPDKLTANKINWLKIYICKTFDGKIIGDCLFNNEHWEEGLSMISEYANSWTVNVDLLALKQFIVFRRCDKYD